jgi:hypothetical protein
VNDHGVASATGWLCTNQEPEVDADPLIACWPDICACVGPLVDDSTGRGGICPAIPSGERHVVSAPFDLCPKLARGLLSITDDIARYSIRLHNELGVVWTRNEPAHTAVFIVVWPGISVAVVGTAEIVKVDAAVIVKGPADVTLCVPTVTVNFPVAAPSGTTKAIVVAVKLETGAVIIPPTELLNCTEGMSPAVGLKLLPVTLIRVPIVADLGLKPATTGGES